MYTDSRGRVRFTYRGVRFEINKDGVLRSYLRDVQFNGSERADKVKVQRLDPTGMSKLYRAINTHRQNVRS